MKCEFNSKDFVQFPFNSEKIIAPARIFGICSLPVYRPVII